MRKITPHVSSRPVLLIVRTSAVGGNPALEHVRHSGGGGRSGACKEKTVRCPAEAHLADPKATCAIAAVVFSEGPDRSKRMVGDLCAINQLFKFVSVTDGVLHA